MLPSAGPQGPTLLLGTGASPMIAQALTQLGTAMAQNTGMPLHTEDLAPLPELVEIKNRYGLRLFVDDAHGTGVFGPHGSGTPAHFGVANQVDVQAGTFSKALATIGGFIAGSRTLIDYLRFTAPTFLFTKSLPLAVVAATQESLSLEV